MARAYLYGGLEKPLDELTDEELLAEPFVGPRVIRKGGEIMIGLEIKYSPQAPSTEICEHLKPVLEALAAVARMSLDDPHCPLFLFCKHCGCEVALHEYDYPTFTEEKAKEFKVCFGCHQSLRAEGCLLLKHKTIGIRRWFHRKEIKPECQKFAGPEFWEEVDPSLGETTREEERELNIEWEQVLSSGVWTIKVV